MINTKGKEQKKPKKDENDITAEKEKLERKISTKKNIYFRNTEITGDSTLHYNYGKDKSRIRKRS